MIEASKNLKRVVAIFFAAMLVCAAPRNAAAQAAHWVIDPATSLAWWQMNPHYGHLWATTCPADPSWHAGEGHTGAFDSPSGELQKTVRAAHLDYRIPLYPRKGVNAVCRKAVAGQIQIS